MSDWMQIYKETESQLLNWGDTQNTVRTFKEFRRIIGTSKDNALSLNCKAR